MVTATLPQVEIQLNPPELGEIKRPTEVIIRSGLAGITSIEIQADQSSSEDFLRARLVAARPILERLHEVMGTDVPQGGFVR